MDAQIKESYHLMFFYRGSTRAPQAATGCHRPPKVVANLPQPAKDCHKLPKVLTPESSKPS